jgi:hypothetical protein
MRAIDPQGARMAQMLACGVSWGITPRPHHERIIDAALAHCGIAPGCRDKLIVEQSLDAYAAHLDGDEPKKNRRNRRK